MGYMSVGMTRAEMEARNKRERKEGRAVTRDWRTGAPMTKEKEDANKRTQKTIESRAKAEAEAGADPQGEPSADSGSSTTMYLLLGGGALVLYFLLKKRKKK